MNIVKIKIDSLNDLTLLSKAYLKGDLELNISKVAKSLGCDRKTVYKYLKGYKQCKTKKRKKYLDDFKDKILEALNDEHQQFSYIDHLYKYMRREHGIKCNRSTFNRYIRNNIEMNKEFNEKKDSFYMRFETEPGQQVQFDLKEKLKLIDVNNNTYTVYIPTLTLGFSRKNYRKLILENTTDNLIPFLAQAFEELGGVPKQIVIDNLSPFVIKSKTTDQKAILIPRFEQFCKDYNIDVFTCVPKRPETKGKTETQNKIVEQLYNYNGKYKDIYDMHNKLEIINNEDNEEISQATHLPRNFLFEKEKGELNPLPSQEIRLKYHLTLKEVSVTNDSLISYKSKKYSVPKDFIGCKVGLAVRGDKLLIYYNKKIIALHTITEKVMNILPEHELFYPKKEKKNENKSIIIKEMENIKFDND